MTFTGGNLSGTADVTITGQMQWTGGTMRDTGKSIIANTATATWTESADKC